MSSLDMVFKRSQSVRDVGEEDLGFLVCGFAERDDADFIFILRVSDGYRDFAEKSEGSKALLTILMQQQRSPPSVLVEVICKLFLRRRNSQK